MDQLADAVCSGKNADKPTLNAIIHPIEKLLVDVPRCTVKDSAVAALPVAHPCFDPVWFPSPGLKKGTELLVTSLKEEALAS